MVSIDSGGTLVDGSTAFLNSDGQVYIKGIVPVGSVVAWLKDYTNTPSLSEYFVECNGQTLSDADSPYDGQTIPDLNGSSATQRFLRGSTSSGSTGGSETHTHTVNTDVTFNDDTGTAHGFSSADPPTLSASTLPSYYEVVWIMRIK